MILTGKNSGYDMTYNTETAIYQLISDGGVVKESKSLDAIEKFLVTGGEKKEKKKFKRIAVLSPEGWGRDNYIKAEATSIAEKPRYSGDKTSFWIIKNKERSKEDTLLLDIAGNHKIISETLTLFKDIKKIEEQIEKLHKGYKYLTPEMMTEKE